MKTLFVCGFDTLGYDTYQNLSYLENTDYFCYGTNDKMMDIEKRLYDEYLAGTYTRIIAHSLGCWLTTRLLPKLILTKKPIQVILMNPFICNTWLTATLSILPNWICSLCLVPKWIAINPSALTYTVSGQITSLNEWYATNLQQINYAGNRMNERLFINTYKTHNNITIIYGENDTIATIPKSFQGKLKTVSKFITIYSKHEPFQDDIAIQHNLKNILIGIIPNLQVDSSNVL